MSWKGKVDCSYNAFSPLRPFLLVFNWAAAWGFSMEENLTLKIKRRKRKPFKVLDSTSAAMQKTSESCKWDQAPVVCL